MGGQTVDLLQKLGKQMKASYLSIFVSLSLPTVSLPL